MKSLITIGLLCVLVLATFKAAVDSGMQKTIAEPSRLHLFGICGTIASSNYGQTRYFCPREIYEKLAGTEMYHNKTTEEINQVIQEAKELKVLDLHQGFTSAETDAGYADYVYLAFRLFGFRIESLLYLYFFIFTISVFVFWVAFRRNPVGSFLVVIFLLAHYIVVKAAPGIGYNLANVVNYRFLPVLAVLPVMHLSLLSLLGNRFNGYSLIGAFLQSMIILFSMWMRGSAVWAVILLAFFPVLKMTFHFIKPRASSLKFRLWPIFLFLSFFIFLILSKPFILGHKYNKDNSTGYHLVWQNMYIGLALHPAIREKFSNVRFDDNFDVDKYYDLVIGPDENRQDSAYKAVIRNWLKKNPDLSKKFLLLRKKYEFKERDDYGYNAAFKWLKDRNMSEYELFNFTHQEGVDYYSAFPTWFKDKKQLNVMRKFEFSTDFKWPKYDQILADVTKEVVLKSPFKVMQTLFLIKLMLFLANYFIFFGAWNNLPPLLLIGLIVLYVYFLFGKELQEHRFRLLSFIGLIFIFSLIPAILIYPGSYVIADSALVFTMFILIVFFSFMIRLSTVLKGKISSQSLRESQ